MHAFVSTVSSSPINVCLVIALDHIPKASSTVLYFRPISPQYCPKQKHNYPNTQWYKKILSPRFQCCFQEGLFKKMVTKGWFSCCKVPLLAFFSKMGGFGNIGFLFTLMNKAVLVLFAWSLALGGGAVGTITGAIKGQTTEIGLLRGAAIGVVAGAIATVPLMELTVHGEPFSKVALLFGLLNGKFFMEWQNAHQWEISNLEEIFGGNYYSDIFEINIGISQGLSQDSIKKLPESQFGFANSVLINPCQEINCIICLEDFKEGDITRILPNCGHSFHLQCLDEWLAQKSSCPMCRKDV